MTYTVQGKSSVFPPCGFCGASYEAHEEVSEYGEIRGHRINRPDQPQHGRYHAFSPMSSDKTISTFKWISVDDRLPLNDEMVLIVSSDRRVVIDHFEIFGCIPRKILVINKDVEPAHWVPLRHLIPK